MLSTWGIEFARRAFFVVAPIAKPTKTSPIQRSDEVAMTRRIPTTVAGPDKTRNRIATTTDGSATTRPLTESPRAYDAGDTFDATNMSWKRNHCLLKYTLCDAKSPVKEKVRTIAPMSDCTAAAWSANTKMKITGRNENRLITTRSIGSRRSGRASNSPMYSASRIFAFNRSPHDLDEGLLEARGLEGHLALLAQTPFDDGQDFFVRSRDENLPLPAVACGRLDDDAHPDARVSLRLVDGPEERGASLVHDQQMVREHLGLVQVVGRQEDRRAALRHVAKHRPHGPPTEGIEPDRRLVEEEHLGVGDHRHRDDHALPESAGQLCVELVAVFPQAEVVHHLARPLSGVLAGAASDQAHVVDVVVRREEHLRPGLLRHDGDVRADRLRVREHVVAQHRRAADGRFELRREDPEERRLARAVAPEEAEDLALVDREGDVLEGFRASGVRLPQAVDRDDRHDARRTRGCYLRLLRAAARQLPLPGKQRLLSGRSGGEAKGQASWGEAPFARLRHDIGRYAPASGGESGSTQGIPAATLGDDLRHGRAPLHRGRVVLSRVAPTARPGAACGGPCRVRRPHPHPIHPPRARAERERRDDGRNLGHGA